MEEQPNCHGCGYQLTNEYWVGQTPIFCQRCHNTLDHLANVWRKMFDERTLTHIAFCQNYAANYHHGAPGHMDYMTISLLAHILENPGSVL